MPKFLSLLDDFTLNINTSSSEVRYNISDNILIPCVVDGYPYPIVQWKFNLLGLQYVDIKNVTKIDFPSKSITYLNFTNVEKRYNGTYKCQTIDGSKSKTVDIIIQSNFII
jgi:hypothetical protein